MRRVPATAVRFPALAHGVASFIFADLWCRIEADHASI